MTKKAVRVRMLHMLKNQKEEERESKSSAVMHKLFRKSVFKKAKRVMFYIAFGGEVETRQMIEKALALGKCIAVPWCDTQGRIKPCLMPQEAKLSCGVFGVPEPAVKKCMRLKDIELVIVPGLAFDKDGNRLGRGKGCYDRFLRRISPDVPAIGLAFDFQVLPVIPATMRDMRVKEVLFA